jgi:hypothetical protein
MILIFSFVPESSLRVSPWQNGAAGFSHRWHRRENLRQGGKFLNKSF